MGVNTKKKRARERESAAMLAALPAAAAAAAFFSRVLRVYDVLMILPQVHLRKPCYDFSFL
jgi:hypothetical protein